MTRAVFMGSPELAVPSLHALAACAGVVLAGVITQPDRPAGRHRAPQPSPVRRAAEALGVPVATPDKAGQAEGMEQLRRFAPEVIVVCAYRQLLPERLLALPPLGAFNLHFSLLPRWRGASPVQAALLTGDASTGVSLQKMVLALDAGPLVASTPPLPIRADDTAGTLGERLARAAAGLLAAGLPAILAGHPPLAPQDAAAATFCRTIKKAQGAVDWSRESAVEIERKRRAYTPWPGCYGFLGDRRLAFLELQVLDAAGAHGNPGVIQPGGVVAARQGQVRLLRVQSEGKAAMAVRDFLNGAPAAVGRRLTPTPAD